MWYHYLALIAGLYLVAVSIYHMVTNRSIMGYITNAVYILIGLGVAWWAYSGITAPPPSIFSSSPMTGGRRRGRY
jgi:hypothetical protein